VRVVVCHVRLSFVLHMRSIIIFDGSLQVAWRLSWLPVDYTFGTQQMVWDRTFCVHFSGETVSAHFTVPFRLNPVTILSTVTLQDFTTVHLDHIPLVVLVAFF
jgi:hypothetical protein